MSSSENLLGQNSKDVFAQALLQGASLLEGNVSIGIQSTAPTSTAPMMPSSLLATPSSASPLALTPSATSLFSTSQMMAAPLPLAQAAGLDPLTGVAIPPARSSASTALSTAVPNFTIMAEGSITVNGNSDFDGNPLDSRDDALIYAGTGFTIRGTATLPTQRDAFGNPIRNAAGKPIVVNNAITVGQGYTTSTLSNNQYGGLVPPPVIVKQTVIVPNYADLKQQELTRKIPSGTPTVMLDARQTSLKTTSDWSRKFPDTGTASHPSVVRITNGGLTLPANLTLKNTVIIVESGDITFSGSSQTLTNVTLVTNNGQVNLGSVQANTLSVLSSGAISMSGNARFSGTTLLANGSGDLTFTGATRRSEVPVSLQVITQGNLIYNGAADTRGSFLAAKNITYNGTSAILGSIRAKGNITFDGKATVIADVPTDPVPPTISAMLAQDSGVGGTTNTDKVTSDPTIAGNVSGFGRLVEFRAGLDSTLPQKFASVLADRQADGSFRFNRARLEQIFGGALTDGTHTLHLIAVSSYGEGEDSEENHSASECGHRFHEDNEETSESRRMSTSFDFTFTLDTKAPTVSSPDLIAASDSGRSNTDNITNTARPKLAGTAEAGSTVRLYQNTQLVGQAIATAQGVWQFEVGSLADGQYRFSATAEDVAGNLSPASTPLTITIDSVVDTPTNLDLIAASDSGKSDTDNITNQKAPVIAGRAEAGTTIQLYSDGQIVGQTTAKSDGSWQVATISLADGVRVLTATATDVAGNLSAVSSPLTVVIDGLMPQLTLTTPITTPLNRASRLVGSVDGTGSAIATVSYHFDGGAVLPIAIDATNRFNQGFDFTNIANGAHVLTITTVDVAGNVRTTALNVTVAVDTTAPLITATLVRDTAPDGATNSDRITFDPSIIGSVTDANRITEFRAGFENTSVVNLVDVTAQRLTNGSFTFNRAQLDQIYGGTLPDGQHTLQLQAKDEYGNLSVVFSLLFTLDTTLLLPTLKLDPSSDSGQSSSDNVTRVNTPLMTGKTDPDVRVQLYEGTQILGQVTSDLGGRWQITTSPLTNGSHSLTVIATDRAGNVKTSSPLTVLVDTVLPQLSLTTPLENGSLTNDAKFVGTIDGTGSKVATLSYRFDTLAENSVSFNASGAFDQALNFTGIANGAHTLTVTATDVAGNVTTRQLNVVVAQDTVAPVITAALVQDTAPDGLTNTDGITFDPTIRGNLVDTSAVTQFRAGLDGMTTTQFVDVLPQRQADSSFRFSRIQLEQIYGSALVEGLHTLHLQTQDQYGNQSPVFNLTFVLDTTPAPAVFDLDPASDGTTLGNHKTSFATVTLAGQTEANTRVKLLETETFTTSDALGRFAFTGVQLNSGTNSFHVQTTDLAGNQATFTQTIDRVAIDDFILKEEHSFQVKVDQPLQNLQQPSTLSFTYTTFFDTTDPTDIRDAFEVALVDEQGNSLVHTIEGQRDAFFNLTEGQPVALGTDTSVSSRRVTLNLPVLPSGKTAHLIFRLVNNDKDTQTTVRIQDIQILTGQASISASPTVASTNPVLTSIDLTSVTDVSPSLTPQYGRTSFNTDTKTLYSQVNLVNQGQYEVRGSLAIVINHLSDASVRLLGTDGLTLDGSPYYIVSGATADNTLVPGQSSLERTLKFYNPNGVQFTYDVQVLAHLNRSPVITSIPRAEALLGQVYTYEMKATDADSDAVSYILLSEPQGMTLNAQSGRLTWMPAAGDLGNQSITLQVQDGHGGKTTQIYNLSVVDGSLVPNRPPLFTSTPIVSANINQTYIYQVKAEDADTNPLTYQLLSKLDGMQINEQTGIVTWQPNGTQLGTYEVIVQVADGRGGNATQRFMLQTQMELDDHDPIITTDANLRGAVGQSYVYQVKAVDPDHDPLTYRLINPPSGMTIDDKNGWIVWIPQSKDIGAHHVTVQVQDNRGGIDTQSFLLNISSVREGKLYGTVFNDVDRNGVRGGTGTGEINTLLPLPNPALYPPIDSNPYYAHLAGFPFIPLDTFLPIAPGTPTSYSDSYQIYDTDFTFPSYYTSYGATPLGMAFKPGDPNTLYRVVGNGLYEQPILEEYKVRRGLGDHIVGIDGSPKLTFLNTGGRYYSYYAGGFDISPDGVLFLSGFYDYHEGSSILEYKLGSTSPDKVISVQQYSYYGYSSLKFVPQEFPGAGTLKAAGLHDNPYGAFFFDSIELSPDGAGTYNITKTQTEAIADVPFFYSQEYPFGSSERLNQGLLYLLPGTPGIDSPTLSVASSSLFNYGIDSNSNPMFSQQQSVVGAGLGTSEWSQAIDPLTGDLLFDAYSREHYSSAPSAPGFATIRKLRLLEGFTPPNPTESGLEGWTVYLDKNRTTISSVMLVRCSPRPTSTATIPLA